MCLTSAVCIYNISLHSLDLPISLPIDYALQKKTIILILIDTI